MLWKILGVIFIFWYYWIFSNKFFLKNFLKTRVLYPLCLIPLGSSRYAYYGNKTSTSSKTINKTPVLSKTELILLKHLPTLQTPLMISVLRKSSNLETKLQRLPNLQGCQAGSLLLSSRPHSLAELDVSLSFYLSP